MTNARYAYLRKTEFQKDRPRIDVTISFHSSELKCVKLFSNVPVVLMSILF